MSLTIPIGRLARLRLEGLKLALDGKFDLIELNADWLVHVAVDCGGSVEEEMIPMVDVVVIVAPGLGGASCHYIWPCRPSAQHPGIP